ncbi:MAG: bifunctional DNA-formamidopyrimidine glycosylase/DNA-(apurinic or apyrimidinic site) lyase [Anaerolineaceae bacterium]|nr:bifunctional DNA-formamidopyrimidine glycosylase/DNA-(apurinic or apyrimidinic site) lyase [Anaerolineaceae bacterium]
MPELPEVETVARGLREPLVGRTIVDVTLRWPRTLGWPKGKDAGEELRCRLVGRRVTSVGRRGKYVVIALDEGYLLIHLKMSGRLQVVPRHEPPDKHVQALFDLDDGQQLRFRDVRKFGRVYLVDQPERVTAGLGPEPLAEGLTLADFRRLLARRSGRLKSLLLNQSFLAGLGNIYADETLYRAGLHPLRSAASLAGEEQERLYRAVRAVLEEAIADQGTTLSDGGYVDAGGQEGRHQERLAVYRRAGQPCLRCQSTIERLVIGGRSSHFCPRCQPGGRGETNGPQAAG